MHLLTLVVNKNDLIYFSLHNNNHAHRLFFFLILIFFFKILDNHSFDSSQVKGALLSFELCTGETVQSVMRQCFSWTKVLHTLRHKKVHGCNTKQRYKKCMCKHGTQTVQIWTIKTF